MQAKVLQLKAGTLVDAKLIAATISTKNQSGGRDPEMQQSKKGNQWCVLRSLLDTQFGFSWTAGAVGPVQPDRLSWTRAI
jgi:hypothetical protein